MSVHSSQPKGKSKRKQKPRLVERCIFWEASTPHLPMDREHVFGDWLRKYVRADANKHRLQHTIIGLPGTLTTRKITVRAGEPLLSTAKIVCKACNSGWLSRIQNEAKPFLIPLIQGKRIVLGAAAQKAIAAWCAMVTITSDYLPRDPAATAISQAERDWFRDQKAPPDHWKIWIGVYRRQKGIWNHYVVPILDSKYISKGPGDPLAQPNTQSTTFVVGDFLVHVLSSTGDPNLTARWIWPLGTRIGLNLPQIFPPKESLIVWPPQSLSDAEVNIVSDALERVIEGAARGLTGARLF
jgi:hypothetical protein